MKALGIALACACALHTSTQPAWSQAPLSFYPYAQGNVWQYRDASTQEILGRRYNDSVWIEPDSSIYIRARYEPDHVIRQERIDTSFNVFNMSYQPDHPRYKLAADSGETWFAGYHPGDSTRHFEISVTNVYQGNVSFCGPSPVVVFTTIKEFTFNMIQFGGTDTLELGQEYLAAGLGLVFALIEGGSAPCLSGAIIDGVHLGEPIVGVREWPDVPNRFVLHQNYPNPFNPLTHIAFDLPEGLHVKLTVFDILGRTVSTLLDEGLAAGHHVIPFDASGVASGVLFYQLKAGTFIQSKRMMVIR